MNIGGRKRMWIMANELPLVIERKNAMGERFWVAARAMFPDRVGKPPPKTEERIVTEGTDIRRGLPLPGPKPDPRKDQGDDGTMCKRCWARLEKATFKEHGRHCFLCFGKEELTVHHIVPRAERGPNEVWNLVPLCKGCHDFVECDDSKPRTLDAIRILAMKRASYGH